MSLNSYEQLLSQQREEEPQEGDSNEDIVGQLQTELENERRRANGILNDLQGTRTELRDLKGKFDVLADSWTQWNEQQKAEAEPEPEDPFDRLEYKYSKGNEETKREIGAIKETISQYQQHVSAQETANQVLLRIKTMEDQFKAETPDYEEAFNFVRDTSSKYLKSAYGFDDAGVNAALANEQKNLILNALQTNRNPAQVVYEMAKGLGWESSGETPVEEQPKPVRGAPTTLSSVPSKGKRRFDLAALAQEDPDEFQKIATDPKQWKKMLIEMGHPE